VLSKLRSRGLTDGLLGGSRFWTVVGAAGWLVKALQWAAKREPEVVYRAELQPGETLVVAREGTETAHERVKRRSRRR
jgi:hypothetical protein